MTNSPPSDPWDSAVAIEADAARCWILDQIRPGVSRGVALSDCLGLVLAADAVATEPSPRFDTSAMDGFATHRLCGAGSAWRLVGCAFAGKPFPGEICPGEAIRIMTGARVPAGAAAVVPLEAATEITGSVRLTTPVRPGANIRPVGSDHHIGDVIVAAGTRLNAAHIAVLASAGNDHPHVVARPRVGVLSTGDELAASSAGIRDANRPGLAALVSADGATAVDLGVVSDDPLELYDRLTRAVDECDAVILTGGVSVGDHDHVKHVLADLARKTSGVARWMRVAVRPAKPLMFATIRGVPVLGLPGNPASAFVSYHLFTRAVVGRLAGDRLGEVRRSFEAAATVDLPRRCDGRLHVVPMIAEAVAGQLVISPAGTADRHHLASTAAANAYAYLPDGPGARVGELVECSWIEPR
jgi:molybdenum cofactor synthesis domain-containing protein